MSDQYKITEEQKKLLLQISAQTLPDNPSRDGYSAEQIRSRLYKPYAALVDLINGVFGTAYEDVSDIQQAIESGSFFSRAFVQWSAPYIYGADEITYYPVGTYGALVKSLVVDNTNHEPYTNGVLNSTYWAEVLNFDGALSKAEEYADRAQAAQAAAETAQTAAETAKNSAQGYAEAAQTSADAAETSQEQAAGAATAAENSATAAAGSATAAANSATEAQGYAQQAKDYAQKHYAVYPSFDALPQPGDSAFIYLVPVDEAETNNNYTEYLWITDLSSYESIGTVNDIDLSGYAQINGTYAGMTVGNATNAQTAQNAQQLGGVAASQYAQISGTYLGMTVGQATNADNATKATQDASGNVITETYATKADVDASVVDLGTLVVGSNTISSDLVQAALDEKCVAVRAVVEGIEYIYPKINIVNQTTQFAMTGYNAGDIETTVLSISGTSATLSVQYTTIPTVAQVNAKYTKPSSGIPESDLAQAVRDKLNTESGITDSEIISRETLPTATADSPDFVQTADGKIYRKKTAEFTPTPTQNQVQGVWLWSGAGDSYVLFTQSVNFISNGVSYTSISREAESVNVDAAQILYYSNASRKDKVCEDIPFEGSSAWVNNAYKTIDFGSSLQMVSNQFYSFLTAYATQQASITYSYVEIADASSVAAKYTKPSTGIPKTDLASAVQTSLGKADTALQSVPLATSSAIGGVKPVAKTDDMTQSVGIDANGALFTVPSGGGGSSAGGALYSHTIVLDLSASAGSLPYSSVQVDVLSARATAYTKQDLANDFADGKILSTVFHYTAPEQVSEGQAEGFLGFITGGTAGSRTISLYDMYLSITGTQSSIPFEITSDTTKAVNVGGGTIEYMTNEEVDALFGSGSTPISFTVAGYSYTAKSGMTWQQFIDSEYNTLSFMPLGNNVVTNDGLNAIALNSNRVLLTDVIQPDASYVYIQIESGGSSGGNR